MQLTCPCCAARFPIEAALTDEQARQAVATALQLPDSLGDRLLRYMALFRPAKRALSWDRATRLLGQALTMMQAGEIERKGKAWRAPEWAWREGLEQVLARRDKLDLPLTSHGYLLEIVAGIAAREGEKAEAARRPVNASHRPAGERSGFRSAAEIIEEKRRAEWDKKLGIGQDDD